MQCIRDRATRSLTYDECSGRLIQASEEANQVSDEGKVEIKIMKKITKLGLALFAVLAFSAIATAAAFATAGEEWLVNSIAVPLGSTFKVEVNGTLLLEDMGKGSPTGILCEGKGKGIVSSDGTDLQETATATKCTTETGSCGSPNAVALNLPWETELVLSGTEIRDLIKGKPGYEVTCFSVFHDKCEGETSVGELENMGAETPADVLFLFSATLSEPGTCQLGGAGEGLIEGELLIFEPAGLSLAVN
jgi:hypothetical protein